jgi:DNA-binding NtrC family response regulator
MLARNPLKQDSMAKTSPRILVLDDEKLIRWSLGQILSQEGYTVDVAAAAEDAQRLAETARYAVVLADLEVCGEKAEPFFKKLLAIQAGAELIILTAVPQDKAGERLGGCRTFRVVEKPFNSEAIKALIQEALRSHRNAPDEPKEV